MAQPVRIVPSRKFHHAKRQWRIEAGGYTLLRLTYGNTGGALKTATVGDDWGLPAYPNRVQLIAAMADSVEKLGGPDVDLWLDEDSQGRQFLERNATATLQEFFDGATEIAIEMLAALSRPARLFTPSGRVGCANGALVASA